MREPGHCTCYQRDRTENLDEEMNSLEIGKLVIICVHADTEKQAGVSPVYNFIVPELVFGSVLMPERSQGGIPRQSWIDTSGLVGRLSGALPHVAGPVAAWSVYLIAGMPLGNPTHFLVVVVRHIPLGQPGLALTILQTVIRREQRRQEERPPARG